jgi:hypothetical protein
VSGTVHYVCPRCGKPLWNIEVKRKGKKVYYYGVHREVLPDGRVKFIYHYIGPDRYTYVTKLHTGLGLELKSPIQEVVEGRPLIIDYLEDIAKAIEDKMARTEMSAYTAQQLADRLQELATKLRQYAQQRAVEESKARAGGDGQ